MKKLTAILLMCLSASLMQAMPGKLAVIPLLLCMLATSIESLVVRVWLMSKAEPS